jgi:hypothetical protein
VLEAAKDARLSATRNSEATAQAQPAKEMAAEAAIHIKK